MNQEQLKKAFDAVCNALDWRGPVDRTIDSNEVAAVGGLEAIREAVIHFTGTVPTIVPRLGGYRITAVGYRAGPAGP